MVKEETWRGIDDIGGAAKKNLKRIKKSILFHSVATYGTAVPLATAATDR